MKDQPLRKHQPRRGLKAERDLVEWAGALGEPGDARILAADRLPQSFG